MSISDLLVNKIWKIAQKGSNKFKKLEGAGKKNIILGAIILALSVGIIGNAFLEKRAYAQKAEPKSEVSAEVMDPLNRIDKGFVDSVCVGECVKQEEVKILSEKEVKLQGLVGMYPISGMVAHIVKRDQAVASFLVAIAKKESNWGKHTPKKAGQECYNFWGYRGKENTTDSGYSCFDSPEHAVQVVGDRIEKLIKQKINTPAKMVVWKCGRDCEAAGGQAAANKWIADVAHYYKKLNS